MDVSDHKKAESRRTDAFEARCWRRLESPLDCKQILPVHPKGNQPWMFVGRADAKAETPILWPPDGKSWLIRKDPDAGKDWRKEKKGSTEDEMFGWCHRLNRHEFEPALGDGEGLGGLACCSPRGRKGSDRTERLNISSALVNTERSPTLWPRRYFLSKLTKDPLSFPVIMIGAWIYSRSSLHGQGQSRECSFHPLKKSAGTEGIRSFEPWSRQPAWAQGTCHVNIHSCC